MSKTTWAMWCLLGSVLSLALCTMGGAAEFAGGTGDVDDPYQIANAEQLISVGADLDLLARHFVLISDIDLDPNRSGGRILGDALIAPDPDPDWRFSGPAFSGSFDGAGHTIRNLTIYADSDKRIGLFGTVGSLGCVYGLGLENAAVTVTGDSYDVGALAGRNEGTIVRCWATGRVSGQEQSYNFGGLVGCVESGTVAACFADVDVSGHYTLGGLVGGNGDGMITCCYATGNVSSLTQRGMCGGLIGASSGTVRRCYAIGHVPVGEYSSEFGGLISHDAGSVVSDSFWDVQTSGLQISGGGRGLTTAQMMDPQVYSLNGWAGDPNWVLDSGNDYPRLAWEGKAGQTIPEPVIDWFAGDGNEASPYIIATADELALIGTANILWESHFVLVSDVNLAGVDFAPIGAGGAAFQGRFDGNGKVIRNLVMDAGDAAVSHRGLFGLLGGDAYVTDLVLEDVTIRGGDCSHDLGILAGYGALATIVDCRVTGSVSAGDKNHHLGGLVGGAFDATIRDCQVSCQISGGQRSEWLGGLAGYYGSVNARIVHVTGTPGEVERCSVNGVISVGDDSELVGGLIGYNLGGTLKACCACANIEGANGRRMLGGLTGYNRDGRISDSYALGSLHTAIDVDDVGGLVGFSGYGSIARCYAAVLVTAEADVWSVGGLVGGSSGTNVVNSFWDTDVSSILDSTLGMGLTTSLMQTGNTFVDAGWDFDDVWMVCEGQDYPRLRWQGIVCQE